MDNIGGAEIVSLILAKELNADLYTTNIDREKISKMGFKNMRIQSIGSIPTNAPLRQQLALLRFRYLNLGDKYDFYIISGDWAMSAAINNRPNLWFVHSPIREIWDLYKFTRQQSVPWYARNIFDVWVHYNRFLNKKYVKHVNRIASNSENTAKRVHDFLKKDATVIYPPINTKQFSYRVNGNFWLSVNRLITHKRIAMQLEAFKFLPKEKLVIVGSFEKSYHFQKYAEVIKSHKPENVQILSWVDAPKLANLYATCKGFITTASDEDFGMAVVEAMASGKPVIAPNEGGFKETVINKKNGLLIDDINPEKLKNAIEEIGKNPKSYKKACINQANKFDTKIFIEKIRQQIQ